MRTDRAARADAGFTLIEVLIAMVILAVGLLALESLGIGAARSVRRAEVQTTYTAVASDLMERTLVRIRQNPALAIADSSYTAASGMRVFRTASSSAVNSGGGNLRLWTVRVRVLPPSSPGILATSDSVNLASNVID